MQWAILYNVEISIEKVFNTTVYTWMRLPKSYDAKRCKCYQRNIYI